MTQKRINEIIALAMSARRAHMCRIYDECDVHVHNGIHTQFIGHSAIVDIEGVTVQFSRFRQHSPCRGAHHYEIAKPYRRTHIGIDVDGDWITINY